MWYWFAVAIGLFSLSVFFFRRRRGAALPLGIQFENSGQATRRVIPEPWLKEHKQASRWYVSKLKAEASGDEDSAAACRSAKDGAVEIPNQSQFESNAGQAATRQVIPKPRLEDHKQATWCSVPKLKTEAMHDEVAACRAIGTVEIPNPMSVASIIQIMEEKSGGSKKFSEITTEQKVQKKVTWKSLEGKESTITNSQGKSGAEFVQDLSLNLKGNDELMVDGEETRLRTVSNAECRRMQLLLTTYLTNPAEYDSHSDALNSEIMLDPSEFRNEAVLHAIVSNDNENELELGPQAIEGSAHEIPPYASNEAAAAKYDTDDARKHALIEKVLLNSAGEYQAEAIIHLHNEMAPSPSILMSKREPLKDEDGGGDLTEIQAKRRRRRQRSDGDSST